MSTENSKSPLHGSGLAQALMASVCIVLLYGAIGYTLSHFLGTAAIAGYEITWSIFASAIIGIMILYGFSKKPEGVQALGLTKPKRWSLAILFGFLGMIVIYGVVIVIASILIGSGLIPEQSPSDKGIVSGPNSTVSLTLGLILVWVNAAFFEELVFRGFILQKCSDAIGKGVLAGIIAAAISAGLFGILHYPSQGLTGVVITGLTGFFLGLLFLLTKRNLTSVVIAHGLINTVSILASAGA